MPVKPSIKEAVSIVKGRATKKKLPEPLVGWKGHPSWASWKSHGRGWDWVCQSPLDCIDGDPTPAALCPLPRLPRKGERVECRIVTECKHCKRTGTPPCVCEPVRKAAKKKASHK